MNERIKEIADRCFSTLPNDSELEKFAESIVYDILNELTNDDSLGEARIETIRRLAERYGVLRLD